MQKEKMMEDFLKKKGAVPTLEKVHPISGNESALVTLKTTRAAAVYIRHSLSLIEQIGLDNKKELGKALAAEGSLYEMGA